MYWDAVHIDVSFNQGLALTILVLSLTSAAIKATSLLGKRRAAAQWQRGAPTGSAGFRLRAKAHHESVQISPPAWDRVAALQWAYSAKAKETFKHRQAATVAALHTAADAADYSDGRERAWRSQVAAEYRASVIPDAVALAISLVIAVLATLQAFT